MIDKSGQDFIKLMIKHKKPEFSELGLVALYCVALGLSESANKRNIHLFYESDILSELMNFIRPRAGSSAFNNGAMI